MRSYCGVYVDAGYLLAAAATRVTGTSLRAGVTIDHEKLIGAIIDQVEAASGLPILRVNWYDSAARGVPDEEQRRIAMLPRVKVRVGRLSYSGEQKGVDLRIGLDLSSHGHRRVVDVAYLLSGDDDLTEAVEEAQSHGVQVIVLAVPGADGHPHGVARHLIGEADGLMIVDPAAIDAAVRPRVTPTAPSPARTGGVPAAPAPTPGGPADAKPATSGVPLPSALDRRPTPAALAARAVSPASSLAYSTSTGQAAGDALGPPFDDETQRLIGQVCQGVVGTWVRTVEPEERQRVLKARPSIPSDLDRALLVDLSDRLGAYDLDEMTRHELRARFWDEVAARV